MAIAALRMPTVMIVTLATRVVGSETMAPITGGFASHANLDVLPSGNIVVVCLFKSNKTSTSFLNMVKCGE